MQLCYRGINYQTKTNSIQTVASGITARFLGRNYTVRRANCPVVLQPNLYQYRGATYQTGNQNIDDSEKYYSVNQSLVPNVN